MLAFPPAPFGRHCHWGSTHPSSFVKEAVNDALISHAALSYCPSPPCIVDWPSHSSVIPRFQSTLMDRVLQAILSFFCPPIRFTFCDRTLLHSTAPPLPYQSDQKKNEVVTPCKHSSVESPGFALPHRLLGFSLRREGGLFAKESSKSHLVRRHSPSIHLEFQRLLDSKNLTMGFDKQPGRMYLCYSPARVLPLSPFS